MIMSGGERQIRYGESSFRTLIENNYRYIDKTESIYKLIHNCGRTFLSRPRRFGKTLLVDTLVEIFQGNRDLFKGLAIYDCNYDWKTYDVIRIDMTKIESATPLDLKNSLCDFINRVAKRIGIDISSLTTVVTPKSYFSVLLEQLDQMDRKVVVLVDEYDYPIISNIDKSQSELNEFLTVLRDFYLSFKSNDRAIHFLFLTGVTRIAYTSIFSGVNNLNDISFDPEFWDILGYTQKELESYFSSDIEEQVKSKGTERSKFIEEIKDWYDGYRFSFVDKSVYNPADINMFFAKKLGFYPYWTETGTSTFIIKLLSQISEFDIQEEFKIPRGISLFKGILKLDQLTNKTNLVRLLYQAGYVTIVSSDKDQSDYYLGFPNREVEVSFYAYLSETVWNEDVDFFHSYKDLARSLIEEDIERFKKEVKRVFDSLQKTPQKYHENAVELVLSLLFRMVGGCSVFEQNQSGEGFYDMVVITSKTVFIIELKMDVKAKVALKQIIDKKYADIYINNIKYDTYSICDVGLCFNSSNCSYLDCDIDWIRKK